MRTRHLLILIGACLAVVGCADDGRSLRPPSAEQTTTSRPAPVTFAPDLLEGESGLRLESADFEPGALMPVAATCDGINVAPSLEWSGLNPDMAKELAISFTDQTNASEPVLLWLVTNISPTVSNIDAGTLPADAVETLNDFGEAGFGSPCIQTTDTDPRRLQFRLHVLSEPSNISSGDPGNEAFSTVNSLTIDAAAVLARVDSDSGSLSGFN